MNSEKKNILIVEDDAGFQVLVQDALLNAGFSTIKAVDGEEGLRMAFQFHPDLILLDLAMPVMDGMTMLKILRRDRWGEGVPVLVLTNIESDDSAVQAFDNFAYDYLIKKQTNIEDVVKMIKVKLNINNE